MDSLIIFIPSGDLGSMPANSRFLANVVRASGAGGAASTLAISLPVGPNLLWPGVKVNPG